MIINAFPCQSIWCSHAIFCHRSQEYVKHETLYCAQRKYEMVPDIEKMELQVIQIRLGCFSAVDGQNFELWFDIQRIQNALIRPKHESVFSTLLSSERSFFIGLKNRVKKNILNEKDFFLSFDKFLFQFHNLFGLFCKSQTEKGKHSPPSFEGILCVFLCRLSKTRFTRFFYATFLARPDADRLWKIVSFN